MAGLFDKAQDALKSDKGEEMSDQALQKGADFAGEKTGGQHDDQIEGIRGKADDALGN